MADHDPEGIRTQKFLSTNAETAYLQLLSAGLDDDVPDQAVRRELQRKGLVVERVWPQPGTLAAAPPSAAFIFVFEKIGETLSHLEQQICALHRRANELQRRHVATLMLGGSGVGCDILNQAQIGPVLKGFHETAQTHVGLWNTGPYVTLDLAKGILLPSRDVLQRGARARGVYDATHRMLAGSDEVFVQSIEAGEEVRVIDLLPMKLSVLDDRAALVPLVPDGTRALLVTDSALVRLFNKFFDLVWARAKPLSRSSAPLAEVDREFVALMASGLKDEAIARQLGISARTVRRRIHDLCDYLGVNNRFAAGVAAWKAGLVAE